MDELRKALTQARDLWRKLTPGKRLSIIAALVVAVGVVAFISLRGNVETYSILYAGLAPDEAGRLIEELKAEKVPYQIANGGTAIEVPEAKVHETRLTLAQKGLPKGSGVGFELFDKQNFGATSFVEQMNYRRALQGELQRTVMSLDEVDSARVHLALPERSLYKQNDELPSASVVLKLKPGRKLLAGQVRGIVHLVSNSVEGLAPEHVTVIDDSGNVLSTSDDAAGQQDAQNSMEKSLERRVRDVVERLVGAGHVAVVVTAEMDYAKTDRTEEQFDKEGVLRSESRTEERAGGALDATGGVAGARGNLPGAPGPTTATTGGAAGSGKIAETKNYEISRVVQHIIGPAQHVKQLHLAILVDQPTQTPRTPEELARISALAREAAGLSKERGDSIEVHSAPFAVAPADVEPAPVKTNWPLPISPILTAAAGGGLFLIFVVALLLVMRSRSKKRKAAVMRSLPIRVGELDSGPRSDNHALSASAKLPALSGKSPRDLALEAVKSDTERAARVVAAWLLES